MAERLRSLKHLGVVAALIVVSAAIVLYVVGRGYLQKFFGTHTTMLGDACSLQAPNGDNPNKTLFVSCSGYE